MGGDSKRRVLFVLQGMDTSGKGGTVRHVVGLLDPNGTRIKAFKAPTPEEQEHDFLWRIRNNVPGAGQIGIFDRSHYEDVLVAKVRKLALPMHIGRRYNTINRFEQSLVDEGTVVVKCFLHISPEAQRERLLARLDDPAKHWKYNPDRRGRPAAVAGLPGRLPDRAGALRHRIRALARGPGRPQVVPELRRAPAAHRGARGDRSAVPGGEFDLAEERARVLAS